MANWLNSIKMSRFIRYFGSFRSFQRNARLYLISAALSGVTTGILYVLYSLYLNSLGYGTDLYGLILFTGTLGAGLAIFPAGLCVDRVNGKTIIIVASLAISLAGMGQILFRTPELLLASAFLAGVCGAFVLVVNAPYLTAHSVPEERPFLFSFATFVVLASTVLGEMLAGLIPLWLQSIPWLMQPLAPDFAWMLPAETEARSYQLALVFAGLIAAPSFIPLFLLDDNVPVGRGRQNTGERVVRLPSIHHVSAKVGSWLREGQLRVFLASPFCGLLLVFALYGLGAGLFLPYLNLFFVSHLKASPALYGFVSGSANLAHALTTLLTPWLALRFGRVTVIAMTRLLGMPVILLMGWTGSLPLAAMLLPVRQSLMNMANGLLDVFSMEVVPAHQRGLANSAFQASYQVVWACSVLIGGFAIERLGYPAVFTGAVVCYSVAVVIFWTRFRRDQDRAHDKVALPSEAPEVSIK